MRYLVFWMIFGGLCFGGYKLLLTDDNVIASNCGKIKRQYDVCYNQSKREWIAKRTAQ